MTEQELTALAALCKSTDLSVQSAEYKALSAIPALVAEVRRLRAEREALLEVAQWYESFYKDVQNTTPEYFELCSDLNATQYLHGEAISVRERAMNEVE